MKFELIAALCFCFILQCQAANSWNIFSSFFGGGFGGTRPPPPPTTTTATTTTTTPSGPNYCNGNPRIWSECRGNPLVREANDSCRPRFQNCSEGVILGELFTKNFLGPVVVPPSPSSSKNQDCVVESITNANGNVVAGRCVPPSSSSGNGARGKRQAPSPRNKIDLLIMLDDSGSIGRENFEKVKRIAAAIIKLLCGEKILGRDYTRVAIMSFSSTTYIHKYPLSPNSGEELDRDANSLAELIMKINYQEGSSTCLIQALQEGYENALQYDRGGRRHVSDVEQDIIVISDGCENCVAESDRNNAIREMTTNFMNNDVNVYVIGVGLANHCKKLLSVLAQGGHCYHFFYVAPWDLTVNEFLHQLEYPSSGFCLSALEHPEGQCTRPEI